MLNPGIFFSLVGAVIVLIATIVIYLLRRKKSQEITGSKKVPVKKTEEIKEIIGSKKVPVEKTEEVKESIGSKKSDESQPYVLSVDILQKSWPHKIHFVCRNNEIQQTTLEYGDPEIEWDADNTCETKPKSFILSGVVLPKKHDLVVYRDINTEQNVGASVHSAVRNKDSLVSWGQFITEVLDHLYQNMKGYVLNEFELPIFKSIDGKLVYSLDEFRTCEDENVFVIDVKGGTKPNYSVINAYDSIGKNDPLKYQLSVNYHPTDNVEDIRLRVRTRGGCDCNITTHDFKPGYHMFMRCDCDEKFWRFEDDGDYDPNAQKISGCKTM